MGGFDLGLERAGMTVVGQVEIDKDCRRVLEKHWPGVWRAEDVRRVGGGGDGVGGAPREEQPSGGWVGHPGGGLGRGADHVEGQPYDLATDSTDAERGFAGIDLVCGGFPCQPFSVAGRRDGEADERNLWPEFRRVVRELRPRWVVAENVPGLLSIDEGRFFGGILDDLGESGFDGVAYAVLDSRWFGVPQRRRRVFIVAGPTRRAAEQVLALCESCAGHSQTGGEERQDVANPLGASATSFGEQRYDLDNETYVPELSYALTARNAKGVSLLEGQDTFVVRTAQTGSNGWGVNEEGIAYTLDSAQQAVGYTVHGTDKTQRVATETAVAGSVRTKAPGSQENSSTTVAVLGAPVRRLTPTECLRLQGFPDDWLDLDPPLSDGSKYRMCGNAVTVPVVEWIGERIMALGEAE
jgi:DNA (cytosine-5)-methyltransferase 1